MPDEILIGCLPISVVPTPPADYDNPCEGECEECKTPIWLSDKKKAVKAAIPNSLMICMYCAVKHMAESEDTSPIKLFNIGEGKTNSNEEKEKPFPYIKGTDMEM